MTQSGNESATFRLVAQCLDPLRRLNKHLFSDDALSYWIFKFRRSVFRARQELDFKYYIGELKVRTHSSLTNRCTFIKTLITVYIKIRWLPHVSFYDHHQEACN